LFLVHGRFPIEFDPKIVEGRGLQIEGMDIIVNCKVKIQVKCDFTGGRKPLGSGNLFLQTAECNPLRNY
jgi:hypothetical protein